MQEMAIPEASRSPFLAALVEACGHDQAAVLTDAESLKEASHDMSRHEAHTPCAVVQPASAEQVAAVVRVCVASRVPMVPRGAGSGVEGGAVPFGGAVVISTARLRRMELREGEMHAVVGAGIHKSELNKFLAPKGLIFGPDPSSNPTIGGMASTGGSGMSTLRFGTTKENVVSLLVVTPQGNIVRTRRPVRKSSSGYEVTQLYLGSEGTLGIICELTVRVKRDPPFRSGGYMPFPDVHAAVETVVAAVRADPPSLLRCELLNGEGVRCTNKIYGTSLDCLPTLFLEFRGNDAAALKNDFDEVAALAVQRGCVKEKVHFAAAGEELDSVWEARRGCYLASRKVRGNKRDLVFISDACVPISRLADCVAQAEADCEESGLTCVICAHIADGNFHCLVPYQPYEEAAVHAFEDRMVQRALDMDGTVTGEHGVGVGKVAHCCREHGPVHIGIQQAVKRALDPLGLMNPGKVLPVEPVAGEPSAKL